MFELHISTTFLWDSSSTHHRVLLYDFRDTGLSMDSTQLYLNPMYDVSWMYHGHWQLQDPLGNQQSCVDMYMCCTLLHQL